MNGPKITIFLTVCFFHFQIENKSRKKVVLSFRTGEMYFGGSCDENFIKLSGLSHGLGNEGETFNGKEVRTQNSFVACLIFSGFPFALVRITFLIAFDRGRYVSKL